MFMSYRPQEVIDSTRPSKQAQDMHVLLKIILVFKVVQAGQTLCITNMLKIMLIFGNVYIERAVIPNWSIQRSCQYS